MEISFWVAYDYLDILSYALVYGYSWPTSLYMISYFIQWFQFIVYIIALYALSSMGQFYL